MVKGHLASYQRDLKFYTNTSMRMVIDDANGNVGIGYNYYPHTDFKLDVGGDIAINHVYFNSDKKLKKDIREIPDMTIDKLYALKGWTYHLEDYASLKAEVSHLTGISDSDTIKQSTAAKTDTTLNFGLIAQEVQVLFPELVKERDDGYLTVDYSSLIPILIEALKRQQSEIELIKNELKMKEKIAAESMESADQAFLDQNKPNPFHTDTQIEFFIPERAGSALLNIYDLAGTQILGNVIYSRGKGALTVQGGDLQPGMYIYCLIVDGAIADKKNMILTE